MGKALVIQSADFSNAAVDTSTILEHRLYDNAALHVDTVTGFCDSGTGRVRTDVGGYVYKVVNVQYYNTLIVSGWFPIHMGAFYSSMDNIGESTFVDCGGQLTKTGTSDITRTVTIPQGAVSVAINLNRSHSNYSLDISS